MNERDELAKVIVAAYGEDAEKDCPCEQDMDLADAILAAGYRKLPGIVSTEYGVRSPWGSDSAKDQRTAEQIVANMRSAGHDAKLIWRGVTEWQEPK